MPARVPAPAPDTRQPQLSAYAEDTATLLQNERASHNGTTRLREIAASEAAFDREQSSLERRVDRILPDNVMYRVETPHGAVGFPVPRGVPIGSRTVATGYGRVTIRVWYV